MSTEIVVIVADLVAGLTNKDPSTKALVYKEYHHVQYKKKVPVFANVSVTFPPSGEKYRFVVIQTNHSTDERILCLSEVQVYVRGKILIHTASYKNTAN